jgi:hypothetical protein
MKFEIPQPGMPITFTIGEKELELRYNLRTLKAMEKELNVSVLKGEGLTAALGDPELLADFLWYGLRAHNPEITHEWVEDNFDASMLRALVPLLAYAVTGQDISALMPGNKAVSPNGAGPVRAGSTSGLPDVTTSAAPSLSSGN